LPVLNNYDIFIIGTIQETMYLEEAEIRNGVAEIVFGQVQLK